MIIAPEEQWPQRKRKSIAVFSVNIYFSVFLEFPNVGVRSVRDVVCYFTHDSQVKSMNSLASFITQLAPKQPQITRLNKNIGLA